MIDRRAQRRGYERAAMIEVIRRLHLLPAVQLIATSHRVKNLVAATLYRSLGFVDWPIDWAKDHPAEVFLMLAALKPDQPTTPMPDETP
jgi:diamine N-acetyltransferase